MSRGAGPERATTSEGYYYQRSRVIHPPTCDGGYRSVDKERTDAGRRTT